MDLSEKCLKQTDSVLQEVNVLLHPNAREALQRDFDHVRRWFAIRLFKLLKQRPEAGFFISGFNPYNEKGYGLQSVGIGIHDEATEEDLLPEGECKNPTLGVIAPGMLDEEGEYGIADFNIALGETEQVTCLSAKGLLAEGMPIVAPASQLPDILRPFSTTVASGPRGMMRVVIELLKDPASPRSRLQAVLKNGVYVCEYLITPDEDHTVYAAPQAGIFC